MNLLAIETVERAGSLAAFSDGNLVAELRLRSDQGTGQSLAPGLKSILTQAGWNAADVDVVAVTVGPGSFTGLRVGVMTAKAFAYSAGTDVLGIDTLQSIAEGAPAEVQTLAVAVDAQRGEVVAGSFARDANGHFAPVGSAVLVELGAWLKGLPPGAQVASPLLRKLAGRTPSHLVPLEPQYWEPTAVAVGRIAARGYAAGQRDDLWKLVPRYSRRSAAEEKWEAKQRGE